MWYLYLLECNDGTYYTGVTKDPDRRLKEHNSGNGSKYVRYRSPAIIIGLKKFKNRSLAQKAEYKVKKMNRVEKRNFFQVKSF